MQWLKSHFKSKLERNFRTFTVSGDSSERNFWFFRDILVEPGDAERREYLLEARLFGVESKAASAQKKPALRRVLEEMQRI